jgi:preprotein translocase subunit SecB
MADETPEKKAPPGIKMSALAQYIRDMSFENILVQKGGAGDVNPDVSVQVNIDAKKRNVENQFEVIIKLMIKSDDKVTKASLFLMELEYGGVFHIENVSEDQLHPFLLIECPRMLFPFVRRVVSDVTRDGGFPPLNLETIDFLKLYRAELTRRAEAEAKSATLS